MKVYLVVDVDYGYVIGAYASMQRAEQSVKDEQDAVRTEYEDEIKNSPDSDAARHYWDDEIKCRMNDFQIEEYEVIE